MPRTYKRRKPEEKKREEKKNGESEGKEEFQLMDSIKNDTVTFYISFLHSMLGCICFVG